MDFEHDIFISYTHLDNEPLFPDDPGWIDSFHYTLEKRLAMLLGKRPKIWRDPDLKGNDVFSETLTTRVKSASSLVCVLSPRYVESDWCQRELDEFSRAKGNVEVEGAGKARIFKVVKTAMAVERHPPSVQPLLGYDFFKLDPETKRVRELDVSIDPQSKKDYYSRLDDLAHDLKDLIERLETSEAATSTTAPEGGAKQTVYLAETSLDLQDERDAVKRDLQRHGYEVLPDCALPLAADGLRELVGQQLNRSCLAIHLVGARYGVVPEGAEQSLTEIQNELAADRAGSKALKRLIWMPPGLEPQDERQLGFIERLRDDERSYVESDLLEFDVQLEALKSHAYEVLEQIKVRQAAEAKAVESRPSAAAEGDQQPVVLYLICDQRDIDEVAPLEDYLFDQGYEVLLPSFEGEEAQLLEDHVYNLTHSDAFLLYYGGGERQWIRNQMRELTKSGGYEDKQPTLATAVYVAPPKSSDKDRFRTHLTSTVLRAGDTFEPAVLEPFLKAIQDARR